MPTSQRRFDTLDPSDLDLAVGGASPFDPADPLGFTHGEREEPYVALDPETVALEQEEEGQRAAQELRVEHGWE